MTRIRTALAFTAVAGALFAAAPAAHADCHDVAGEVTNCTYVNGTCVYGGGKIGDHSRYMYQTPCP
jgi:hypothetical protein